MSSKSGDLGRRGEEMAAKYLAKKGYRIVARNFKCQPGEIDIVAYDADSLVFVEVKYYSDTAYHDALDALTPSKIKKIIRAAEVYLWQEHVDEGCEVRFDVVAIDRHGGEELEIKHLQDAFDRDR